MAAQSVYFFAEGKADGNAAMKDILGGKGAGLAEMTNLGIPVPPGFTISAQVCQQYYSADGYTQQTRSEIESAVSHLEKVRGQRLGDSKHPLLVSVRSGAAISMPGMMDTVLNLGLSDTAMEGLAISSGNRRFACDAYRRFIQMFGDVVRGIAHSKFETILSAVKAEKGLEFDKDLDERALLEVIKRYKELYKSEIGEEFPQDPKRQLFMAIDAVFGSWNNERAITYRRLSKIEGLIGTAVNVQSMVFGNMGAGSGTGVCFSRDPATGENEFYGEYLLNAQGEDVVAGIRTPEKISALSDEMPRAYKELLDVKGRLEAHYKDLQDMEFTIEKGELFLLQTRSGKRSGAAAVRIAMEMVKSGLISHEEAVMRVQPEHIDQLLHPMIDSAKKNSYELVARGIAASPGAASGKIVLSASEAERRAKAGEKDIILVRQDTSPEDIGGMTASRGILTATGGKTSHAAVVARGMGVPCVAGCAALIISEERQTAQIGDHLFHAGDVISFDGGDGAIYKGEVALVQPAVEGDLETLLGWADKIRLSAERKGLPSGFSVRANADTPEDARRAIEFGADGVGLCRTEHMFFAPEKIKVVRALILADTPEKRETISKELSELQVRDFEGIFRAMSGHPVTIRLLDPPLHEFLPKEGALIEQVARDLRESVEIVKGRISALHEFNPMLGNRGCRLGFTRPEIYDAQLRAIFRAASFVQKEGIKVFPEIMIPLISTDQELRALRERTDKIGAQVSKQEKQSLTYKVGTMIETPRAALISGAIAKYADFYSFGTNDLTQMCFAFSRDDSGTFLPLYIENGNLKDDPFQTIDSDGVAKLMELAVTGGRAANPDLYVSICGEHGGDPRSIEICFRLGLNTVSCSPYRVPVARQAAAHAVLKGAEKARR